MKDVSSPQAGPDRPLDRQFVVALAHVDLVVAELSGIPHRVEKRSTLLDLALIELADPESAAKVLAIPEMEDHRPPPTDAMGEVLLALRLRFAKRFSQWSPALGRNRAVEQFHGAQEVIHSGGDPVALQAPLAPPARSSGPGRGVRIGLIDTGLFQQPWLAGAWSARYADQLPTGGVLPFAAGHATFVAGLILSQAAGATVEARRVFDDDGVADSWTVGEEIVRMGRSGIDVLNLSFACLTEDGRPPFVLATAVDRIDPDVVVVAAAGNQGGGTRPADQERRPYGRGSRLLWLGGGRSKRTNPSPDTGTGKVPVPPPAWPAALDDVIAVGAVDAEGRRAGFSPDAPWVDVHAPGVGVRSTFLEQGRGRVGGRTVRFPGGWAEWSGTSFAAGLVSGAIAAATEPGRVTAQEAAHDLLAAAAAGPGDPIDGTGAKALRLPLW